MYCTSVLALIVAESVAETPVVPANVSIVFTRRVRLFDVRTVIQRQNEHIYIPDLRPEPMKI